jgi:hypothetical protein
VSTGQHSSPPKRLAKARKGNPGADKTRKEILNEEEEVQTIAMARSVYCEIYRGSFPTNHEW